MGSHIAIFSKFGKLWLESGDSPNCDMPTTVCTLIFQTTIELINSASGPSKTN